MNVAVIGLGYWGPNIVRNFKMNNEVERLVCCDTDKLQLEKIKKNFRDIETTTNYNSVLNDDDIDAVAIVTPVDTHYELAKQALLMGKHIIVEKPLTSNVKQAEELVQLANDKKLVAMVDHTFLYTSAVKKIKSLIIQGEVGDIYYYDSVRINLGLFQRDVNVIWDLAPHDFSIMNHLLNQKPVSLIAMGSDHIGKGYEDVAYVHIEFENNLIAHVHLNWLSPVKVRKTLIAGSNKMIVYDDMDVSEKIKVYDKGIDVTSKEDEYQKLINYRSGDIFSPVLDNTEALKDMINDFVSSINNGSEPKTDIKEGLKVIKLLEATQKSISNGGKKIHLN